MSRETEEIKNRRKQAAGEVYIMDGKRDVIGRVIITQDQISRRAAEIGQMIEKDFEGEEVVLVGILRGAVLWMGDIMKNVGLDMIIDFMAVSSYGASTKSSGIVKINKDLDTDIEGKNVIIVEDIVDSGTTLNYLKGYFENREAKTVKICALLDKPEGRTVDIKVDYKGFTVDDKFIVGYGLDYAQKYRNLPYITYLEDETV